ncbi:MAG: tyrosine-type recombinase/integrase, partial [Candidatus Gracilibacteria bacterium]
MLLRCLFNQWEGWRIAEARRVFGETEKAPPPPEAGETSAPLKETPLTPEEAAKELKQVEGKLQALKLAITTLEKNLSSVDPQKATPQGTEFQELHNQAQRMHDGFSKALEAVSMDTLLKTEALQANVDQRLDRILQKTTSTIPDSKLLNAVTASTVSATIASIHTPGAPLLAASLEKVTSTPPDSIETKMKALEIRKNETLEKMGGKKFDLFSAYQSLPTFLKQRIDRSDVSRKQNADPLMKLRALESVVNALEEYQRLTDSTQGIRYGATEGAYGPNLFDDHFSEAGAVLHNAFFDTAGGMGGKGSYVELVGARLGINPDPNDLQEKNLNAHFALKVKGLPDSEAVTTASSFSEDSISISLKGKTIEEAVADAMREFVERKDVQKTLKKQFRQHEETAGLKRDAVARQDAHIDKVTARQDRKEERKDDRRLDDPQHPSSHPDYKGESREDLVNRILDDHGNPEDYIIRWEEKGGKNGHWIAKRFQDRTEEGTAQAPAKETEKKGEKPHEDLLKKIIIDQPVGLGPISPKAQELLVKSGVKIQLEKIGQDPQAKQYQTLLVFSEKSPPANYPFPQGTRMNFSTKDEKGPLTLTTTDEKGTQKVYLVTSDGLTLPPAKPSPAPAIQKEGKLSNIETSQAGPINIDSVLDSEIKNEITDTDLNILSKLTSSTPEFTTSADRLYRLVVQEGHSRILWNSKPQEKNIWGDVSNENLHVVETPPGTYVDCTLVPSGSYLKTNEGNRYFSSHNGKEFVFEEKGKKLSENSLRYTITKAFKEVGLKVTPHQLRHAYATELLNNQA